MYIEWLRTCCSFLVLGLCTRLISRLCQEFCTFKCQFVRESPCLHQIQPSDIRILGQVCAIRITDLTHWWLCKLSTDTRRMPFLCGLLLLLWAFDTQKDVCYLPPFVGVVIMCANAVTCRHSTLLTQLDPQSPRVFALSQYQSKASIKNEGDVNRFW